MTTITQNIDDIAGVDDNTSWTFAVQQIRESDDGTAIVSTKKVRKYPLAGVLTVELDPGPAAVLAADGKTYPFTVPDTDTTLWPLIQAAVTIPPSSTHQQLLDAVDAWLDSHTDVWANIPDKPAFIGAGSTAAAARAAIDAAQGLTATAVKTATYTAAAGDLVPADAGSTSAFTVTLPAAPADKARVAVKKIDTNRTRAITVACGGSDVFNKTAGSTSLTLQLPNQAVSLQYKASGAIWYVVSTDVPLGETDARYQYFTSILNYGALGNGTTDDTTAVQAAVDAVFTAGGGVVFIPKGSFVVSKVTLKQGVSILGGGRGSILKAKSGVTGTDFGVIEMAQGQIDFITLAEFSIQGNGNSGQWGIYLYADKGAGSTGGLYQSNFTHLNVLSIDNGIWLRGGRTGSVEPHQFLNFDNVTIQRTAAGAGDCLRSTGQVNQIQRRNCIFQSASVGSTRTGRALYFGRDPNEVANASGRYPQGHSGVLDTVQGADWLIDIESGANLVFQTPYCENAHNVFRVRSVNVSNPTDVTVISPRFAAVATTTEVPTTGGTLVDIGDYCDVRIKGPGFISPGVGTIPTPYVIQNDSVSGGSAAVNLSVEGFITNGLTTTLFDVPVPVKTMTNAGTASIATLGAWKNIRFRGRGVGAASLGTIQSLHSTGESISFVVTSVALDINNTDNIVLPNGGSLVQLAIGDKGKFTKFYDGTAFKWRFEKSDNLVVGATVQAWDADLDTWATKTAPTGTVLGTTDTQTQSNKRITKRVAVVASSATPTYNTDNADVLNMLTLATNVTNMSTNETGTPNDGDQLLWRIKSASAQTISWGANHQSSGAAALLVATLAGKTHTMLESYDGAASKWTCLAVDATGY